jgi:hypothetical protein
MCGDLQAALASPNNKNIWVTIREFQLMFSFLFPDAVRDCAAAEDTGLERSSTKIGGDIV